MIYKTITILLYHTTICVFMFALLFLLLLCLLLLCHPLLLFAITVLVVCCLRSLHGQILCKSRRWTLKASCSCHGTAFQFTNLEIGQEIHYSYLSPYSVRVLFQFIATLSIQHRPVLLCLGITPLQHFTDRLHVFIFFLLNGCQWHITCRLVLSSNTVPVTCKYIIPMMR